MAGSSTPIAARYAANKNIARQQVNARVRRSSRGDIRSGRCGRSRQNNNLPKLYQTISVHISANVMDSNSGQARSRETRFSASPTDYTCESRSAFTPSLSSLRIIGLLPRQERDFCESIGYLGCSEPSVFALTLLKPARTKAGSAALSSS